MFQAGWMLVKFLETHLGWACKEFGEQIKNLVNENNKKLKKLKK